jgi:hypothetical protein
MGKYGRRYAKWSKSSMSREIQIFMVPLTDGIQTVKYIEAESRRWLLGAEVGEWGNAGEEVQSFGHAKWICSGGLQ